MTKTLCVKIPAKMFEKIPSDNVSKFVREAIAEKLKTSSKPAWKPKTAFGRELLALRKAYERSGGEMLSAEQIAEEIRARRGGIA